MPDVPTGRLRQFGALVARHEGIAFTLAYIALAAIGMIHLAAFYTEFRINVLEFADVSDLLLAPFRDPFVVLISLLPIPVFALSTPRRIASRPAAASRSWPPTRTDGRSRWRRTRR